MEVHHTSIPKNVRSQWAKIADVDRGKLQKNKSSMSHIGEANIKIVVAECGRRGRRGVVIASEAIMSRPVSETSVTSSIGTSPRGSSSTSQHRIEHVETALESEILALQNSGSTAVNSERRRSREPKIIDRYGRGRCL